MAKIYTTGAYQIFQNEFDGKVTSIYMDENMNIELEVIEDGGTVTILPKNSNAKINISDDEIHILQRNK